MSQYNESINRIIEALPEDDNAKLNDSLITEAIITLQKTIKQAKSIKISLEEARINKRNAEKTGKLILLCADLERISASLTQLMREYNL